MKTVGYRVYAHSMAVLPDPSPSGFQLSLESLWLCEGCIRGGKCLDVGRATCASEPLPQAVNKPKRHRPLPAPLDSGFRRSDDLGGRNGQEMPRMANGRLLERSVFIRKSLIPAVAGTPRYENRGTGWRVFSAAVRHYEWSLAHRERGTSPSSRVVFDRATFPRPHPSGFQLSLE